MTGTNGQTGVVDGVVTLNTYTTSIGAFVPLVKVSAKVLPFTNVVAPVTVPPVTAPYVALTTLI